MPGLTLAGAPPAYDRTKTIMPRPTPIGPDSMPGGVPDDRDAADARVSLTLLGGFGLTCDGAPLSIPLSGQRVLAFLALNGRTVPRAHVAGTLWIDATEARAGSALRTAVWRIGSHCAGVLHCDGGAIALAPHVAVDIVRLRRQATAVVDGRAAAPDLELLAAIRDAGDLLPGWYDDWVLIERERLRQMRLHALERLCLTFSGVRRHREATEAGLAAIAADPLRESAHRALVAAHLAQGNAGDALRQYRLCRDLLSRELGIRPSAQLDLLVADLQQPHQAGVRAPAPQSRRRPAA